MLDRTVSETTAAGQGPKRIIGTKLQRRRKKLSRSFRAVFGGRSSLQDRHHCRASGMPGLYVLT